MLLYQCRQAELQEGPWKQAAKGLQEQMSAALPSPRLDLLGSSILSPRNTSLGLRPEECSVSTPWHYSGKSQDLGKLNLPCKFRGRLLEMAQPETVHPDKSRLGEHGTARVPSVPLVSYIFSNLRHPNCYKMSMYLALLHWLSSTPFGWSVPRSLEAQSHQDGIWKLEVSDGKHSNWQQGRSWHEALIPPWHSALNLLGLSRSVMAWELEPENKRWQKLQAKTGEHCSPHIRHYCAAFQQFGFNIT
ncbi:hypothetical protein SUZIE_189395 [Sciurus carolinensis]|uniref:Uncharacterized protein n=1 Tax=Sciurus carolinensis TaxID=30640 RepID=A0AA41T7X6_SCICA|nr:hypothetical protein [Sciurus carolinensis]